ncbi:MAG TPA: ABC transporter permease [Candidatus Sulfotelmatobacter sp.]|nr:ABC transporter permease [Candidatus Sulfotelmatobacter sp.]
METFWQDIRFGLRMLAKNPGFTAVAVLTLALGIGANTAIFSVINAIMLRALPVRHPEQLVTMGNPARVHSWGTGTPRTDVFSYPLYREVRDHNNVFSSVLASSRLENLRITIEGGPENVSGRLVTENYFQTLGIEALLGRTFTADEDRIPGGDPVVVISYGYWQRRFSGDPAVIGRKVRLDNYPFTIIGVAPPGFFGEVVGDRPDLWAPMMMQPQLMPGRDFLENVNTASLLLMGRLKPGATIEQARGNVNEVVKQALTVTLGARLSSDDREAMQKTKITVEVSRGGRGLSRLRQEFATPLLLLMALVVLVLLVACVNVANLMLASTAVRQREIAVRFAMGAPPSRIVRQFLTESLLLASLGGVLGLVLANWGAAALVGLANANRSTSNPLALGFDWRVLGFTAAICLSAGIVFGLAPALGSLYMKLGLALKEGGRDPGTGPRRRFSHLLVSLQIALGVLVLMTAGLLVRSLRNLQEADLGYSRDQLLLARVDVLASGYKGPALQNVTTELLGRLSALPGVRSVTVSSNGLFSGTESSDGIRIDGVASGNDEDNVTNDDEVGPNYFSTIGVPIVLGREITPQDYSTVAPVAVVNETFAKFYFGGRNPLGHKIFLQDSDHPGQPPYEIVGVARDVQDHSLREAPRRRMYAPLGSATFDQNGAFNFELRAIGNPQALINSVRSTIRELNPDLVIDNVETAGDLVADTLTSQALVAKLSSFFGALVLLLVCVGLYGSMAYNVTARTKEIGVRMALGATRRGVIWLVTREAWIVLAVGVAIGIPAGIAATRLFKTMLFGVNKSDPLSIAAAILTLFAVSVAAAVIPARRATNVDPVVALRYE